jgi:MFS family permease
MRGILVYLVSATLARSADAAAIVGVVLLADSDADHAGVAGVLAACITAPHLAGPFAARLLDRARHKRVLLASACVVYAAAVAAAALLIRADAVLAGAGALVIAGLCGPLLTGGLSSQLGAIVGAGESAQRRAQGMDAFTYGVASTCGPAVAALIAASAGPMTAVLTVASFTVVAAVVVLFLPPGRRDAILDREPAMRVRQALVLMLRTGALRRVTVATAVSSMPLAAMPLIAVAFARGTEGGGAVVALLTAAFGLGNLGGAIAVTIVPLRGSPELLTRRGVIAVTCCLAFCTAPFGLVWTVAGFALTGAAAAALFAASLAARAAYSSPTGRAQVFVTMAGIKVAFSSLGVALAGAAIAFPPSTILAIGVLIAALAVVAMVVDARIQAGLAVRRQTAAAGGRA